MEFHYTTDTNLLYDENRTYTLAGTTTAANGTYAFGETVRFDYTGTIPGNLIVKTRGINATTVGPFSQPTGNVTYTPATAAGAITNQTSILNGAGELVTALGASYLLGKLANLVTGNTAPGGLLDTISSALGTKNGTKPSAGGIILGQTSHYTYNSTYQAFQQVNVVSFTPKNTGQYRIQVLITQSGSHPDLDNHLHYVGFSLRTDGHYSGSVSFGSADPIIFNNSVIASGAYYSSMNLYITGFYYQASLDRLLPLNAGTTYYMDAFVATATDLTGSYYVDSIVKPTITDAGLSSNYSTANNIGNSGTAGYTTPQVNLTTYTVEGVAYDNTAAETPFETPVSVELEMNRNFGTGRLTFGTDTYDNDVFGGLFQTVIDTGGYTAGTYDPVFEYWDQGIDAATFSANYTTTLNAITIASQDPAATEFTPTPEEVVTAPETPVGPELPAGDPPAPEFE
jgi:hypothetical protein